MGARRIEGYEQMKKKWKKKSKKTVIEGIIEPSQISHTRGLAGEVLETDDEQ